MKILHVITSLRTGGAEKLMVDLLPRLKNMGDDVELCVFDGVDTPFMSDIANRGVVVHKLTQSMYSFKNVIKLYSLVKRFDVVHTHNSPCQFAMALLKPFYSGEIVTTEHSTSNRRRGNKLWLILDRWMYSCYKAIICVSEIAGQNIKKYTGDNNLTIIVIPNGIEVEKFASSSSDLALSVEFANCHKGVMVAGFRYEKDQKTVIEAYKDLPEKYHLIFVGDGEKRDEYEKLVEDHGLKDRVHFLGVRNDVPNVLKTADVVIMSSHREGLSLSNLEGMACGRPFIASDVPGLHEIVGGYGVLFPHEDAKALAKEIMRLAEDREWYDNVVSKCQERARMFDIQKMAEGYRNLYYSLKK